MSTGDWTGIAGIIQHRRISPPDPQVFAGLELSAAKGHSLRFKYSATAVTVKGTENQEVYVTFSPQFERIWLESKKRLSEYVSQKPANLGLRSRYSIRFYDWAKKYVEARTKTISLEELRRVLGLESAKDAEGNVIHEAPMPVWANFRQRALDVAILEINAKTDLKINQARVHRTIKAPSSGRAEIHDQDSSDTETGNSPNVDVAHQIAGSYRR